MTFSIVARDQESGEIGIGVQSHFLAVGSVASFAEPGVGGIATQAFADRRYGALGLKLLAAGEPASAVLEALLRLDDHSEIRQIGVVDAQGYAAAFTGARCVQHAAHLTGPGMSIQGNMLASPEVTTAMRDAYLSTDDDLAGRILAALDAGQAEGGDARGVQSAALTVVGPQRDGRPWNAVLHDERVDDSPDPLAELRRLTRLRRTYRRIGGILFETGPLFDESQGTDEREMDQALADLATSAAELGDDNYEATLWRVVLLAKSGRLDEATAQMPKLLTKEPALREFFDGLVASGFLEKAAGSRLLADAGRETS